ncbi:MAG TPA: hypothetical protein VMR81_00060 [Patescibacteria group bacterium]|nr:hypothetical protein [Patescibacteria group bacterium]
MGFIGAITILIRKRSLEVLALIGVSFSVFVFESYSIFKGNTTIFLPELFPFDYYNIRYGLYSLPFFIMFTSSLFIIKNKFISFLTILVIIYAVGFPLYKFKPITLTDAIVSRNGNAGYEKVVPEYVTFFHKNYSGGLILLSSGVASDILLEADINLKNYITEGNGKYWDGSLVNPEKYASWVILNKDTSNIRNLLGIKLINSPKLAKYYNLIYSDNQILIYKRL